MARTFPQPDTKTRESVYLCKTELRIPLLNNLLLLIQDNLVYRPPFCVLVHPSRLLFFAQIDESVTSAASLIFRLESQKNSIASRDV